MAIYSTGVIVKDTTNTLARTVALNVDTNGNRTVTVSAIDWTTGLPVALTVTPPATFALTPNTSHVFDVTLAGTVLLYEIRINVSSNEDLAVNVFGLVAATSTVIAGNTVYQQTLKLLELD